MNHPQELTLFAAYGIFVVLTTSLFSMIPETPTSKVWEFIFLPFVLLPMVAIFGIRLNCIARNYVYMLSGGSIALLCMGAFRFTCFVFKTWI